ncbi:MAG: hypothetical protein ACM3JD_05215 [Rudaea sp.]
MNDDFLYLLREPPRREFADALHARISASSELPVHRRAWLMRAGWAPVAAFTAIVLFLAFFPGARAQTGATIRLIEQMIFVDRMPTLPPTAAAPTPMPMDQESISLAEAAKVLPFPLHVPTWAPAAFTLMDQATILHQFATKDCDCEVWEARLIWYAPLPPGDPFPRGNLPWRITLHVWHPDRAYVVADLQTLEELTINGRRTALLGLWAAAPADPRQQNLSKRLMWRQDGAVYELTDYYGGVSTQDLIRMAESIP